MSDIHEPDLAMSIIVDSSDLGKLLEPLPKKRPWLAALKGKWYMPEVTGKDVEVIHGLPEPKAAFFVGEMEFLGIRARCCRWDQVEKDVVRAPHRIPGIVGNHFGFSVEQGLVLFQGRKHGERHEVGWISQYSANHEHFLNGEDVALLARQESYIRELKDDLELCFPGRRFIIELEPGCAVSFYEPVGDAPVESETEWKSHIGCWSAEDNEFFKSIVERLGVDKIVDVTLPTCNECGGIKVVQPYESLEHPGVVLGVCDGCGKEYIAASRIICVKVGNWD